MSFRKKLIRPTNEPERPNFKVVLPDERKPEISRHVQHSIIGQGTIVTGDLESAGDILVEGAVEGNITCRTLTLGGEPTITGNVQAETVRICGRFAGDLRAKMVVLTKAARMTGDIFYETLDLQDGSEFEGRVRCTSHSSPNRVKKDGTAPQS